MAQTRIGTAVPSSLPPNGTAGGDLSGSYPNPSVSFSNDTLHILKTGDSMSGDLIGKDFVKTRSITFTRDGSGLVTQIAYAGGRTITVTRTGNYITSLADGTYTKTFTRNGSSQITAMTVT